MAFVLADRVKETTSTTGQGTITLGGAVTGYQTFGATGSVGDGNQTYYTIAGQNTSEWEVGIGTYTASGTTLSRDVVLASSASGAKVSFSAGTKDVFVTYPAKANVISPIRESLTTISFNYTIQAGRNGSSVGPVTISTGYAVTIPTGQRWIIWG